ncbi:helix-turn-helix domain-containing protein [Nocardia grenadensis]|uniref:helix-turn-helix domain-containing protein n=1 Tax=Nocardia grenadensis TaxID=931537 RepID=UPI0007A48401|nr:MerR family transcriptional regulator [Nocardia grenadensis]
MSDHEGLFTIGELARRTGLSVRTIRFWSDSGVVPATDRSPSGYRLYDTEAVARLDLVRTLRELGLDLPTVQKVLRRQATVAEVAASHARALDAEIRTLRIRRAVLRSVAHRGSSTEEMRIMHKMAELSAAERQRLIDDFVNAMFDGIADDAPGATIAHGMRMLPPELPDDPSPEQVNAWIELAELVTDTDFQARCRQMAVVGATGETGPESDIDPDRVSEYAGRALDEGVTPGSVRGKEVLEQIVDAALPAAARRRLADRTEVFTDRRVERYWELLAVLNDWPRREPRVPAWEWFIDALRAHA